MDQTTYTAEELWAFLFFWFCLCELGAGGLDESSSIIHNFSILLLPIIKYFKFLVGRLRSHYLMIVLSLALVLLAIGQGYKLFSLQILDAREATISYGNDFFFMKTDAFLKEKKNCRWGSTHSRIDDLYFCPPNIIF